MIVVGSAIFACVIALAHANCYKPHETYSTCGDTCAPTCGNPYPTNCNFQCQEGCFCEPGYIRDENGNCVQAYECRSKRPEKERERCGANEKYRKCRRTCEGTCKHPKPQFCDEPCFDFKCQCRRGFVRDRHGDCIPYDLCPQRKVCDKNEVWSNNSCVQAARCQKPRCDNHKLPRECENGGLYCTNGGCVCKKGFVRTRGGKCVEKDKCYRSTKSTESNDCESTKSCGKRQRSTESTESSESRSKSRRKSDSDSSSRKTKSTESSSRDKSSSNCQGRFCGQG